MPTISLAWGSTTTPMDCDPSQWSVIQPTTAGPVSGDFEEHRTGTEPLERRAEGKRVLVIVSDLTRPTGTLQFLPRLLPQLEGASRIRFLFATGIHRPLDDGDKVAIVGQDVFDHYPMLDHEPESGNIDVGRTRFGNRVEIDHQVLEDELVVLTGAIGFHYFAGFSGGRKSLLPGVASKRSIEFNHLLVLNQAGTGRNPNVCVATMDGNPVHEDMVDGARLVDRELYLYNTILDSNKQVRHVFSGDWVEAHKAGAAEYLSGHSVRIDRQRRLVVASCGGFPRDINMIQAHKTLEFAQYACSPGGTIILLAECREGAGHSSFFHWFDHQDLDEFERRLRAGYEVYGQTAYSLLSKARRFRVICVSALDPDRIRTMGMEPAPDLASALAMVDGGTAASGGYILPYGAEVLPVVGQNPAALPAVSAKL